MFINHNVKWLLVQKAHFRILKVIELQVQRIMWKQDFANGFSLLTGLISMKGSFLSVVGAGIQPA